MTTPLSSVLSATHQMDILTAAFSDADIKHDGTLSRQELMLFIHKQGGLGMNKKDQERLYDLLQERNALNDSESFVATAVATSELNSSHHIEMYVPSTADIATVIDEDELQQRVQQTAVFFTQKFHGASVMAATMGYYKTDEGELVKEKTHKIYSFTTLATLKAQTNDVMEFARQMCDDWSQECIAIVIDGTMHFVYSADESETLTDEKLLKMFFSRVKRCANIDTVAARVKRVPRTPSPKKK